MIDLYDLVQLKEQFHHIPILVGSKRVVESRYRIGLNPVVKSAK